MFRFRRMKTTQERRANQGEDGKYVRPKRKNIPNSYDDIFSRVQRSWKENRKTKYKVR